MSCHFIFTGGNITFQINIRLGLNMKIGPSAQQYDNLGWELENQTQQRMLYWLEKATYQAHIVFCGPQHASQSPRRQQWTVTNVKDMYRYVLDTPRVAGHRRSSIAPPSSCELQSWFVELTLLPFAGSLLSAIRSLCVRFESSAIKSQPGALYVCSLKFSEAGSSTATHALDMLDILVLLFVATRKLALKIGLVISGFETTLADLDQSSRTKRV